MKIKVIRRRGRKNPRYTCNRNCELATVIEYVSAVCRVIPQMSSYKGLVYLISWYVDEEEKELDTFACFKKGWIDHQLG